MGFTGTLYLFPTCIDHEGTSDLDLEEFQPAQEARHRRPLVIFIRRNVKISARSGSASMDPAMDSATHLGRALDYIKAPFGNAFGFSNAHGIQQRNRFKTY